MSPDFEWHTKEEKADVVRYWWRKQKAMCHLCGEQMEPYSQAKNSPWAATIEHVTPRRENGPNTVGNVRLAHRWCNNALGALWQMNKDRAAKGLSLLTVEWAMASERGKLKVRGLEAARPIHRTAHRAANTADKDFISPSLQRGATLPPDNSPLWFEHSANKPARRMTALETAQWLRESQGRKWKLA